MTSGPMPSAGMEAMRYWLGMVRLPVGDGVGVVARVARGHQVMAGAASRLSAFAPCAGDRHDYLLRLVNAFEAEQLPLEADHSAEFASFARELDERGQSISHSLPASHAIVIDSYTSTAVPTDRVEALTWIV